jgi:hypothetical protein
VLFQKRGERSQGLVHFGAVAEEWIGAKRRPLTEEGRQPLSCLLYTTDRQGLEDGMQQPHLTTYAAITEVRTVTGATTCNQLLAEGWVLLGVYPFTTVAEMGAGQPGDGQQQKRIEDTQRCVRRMVGYVMGRRRA